MLRQVLAVSAAMFFATATDAVEAFKFESDAGTYKLRLTPKAPAATIGELHTWQLLLSDTAGNLIDGATVHVDGRMPGHGHGLPTAPKVTDTGEAGHYLVEGLRFNMPGDWELELTIEGAAGEDTATLEFGL